MSFIRIILSEATKTTNDDLSKSAYDSALAGVEDAKVALMKYHQCIDQGYTGKKYGSAECETLIYTMDNEIRNSSCDVVSKVLNRIRRDSEGEEVIVQENPAGSENSSDMLQAYTCVKITEELEDYRSQVNASNRLRVIPIRTTDVNSVTAIKFDWFSNSGHEDHNGTSDHFPTLSEYNSNKNIPVVNLDIYQTDVNYSLGELSVNNGSVGTDHASLYLRPASSGDKPTKISVSKVLDASDKSDNEPINVNCTNNEGFKCQSIVQIPKPFNGGPRNSSSFLLRVEIPYGQDDVDFAVTLCTGADSDPCGSTTKFVGVQAQIDSTGRANDVFRRVDGRVELVDTNFPYPEFAVQLDSSDDSALAKDFWVTDNCWRSDPEEGVTTCSEDASKNNTGPAETVYP